MLGLSLVSGVRLLCCLFGLGVCSLLLVVSSVVDGFGLVDGGVLPMGLVLCLPLRLLGLVCWMELVGS